MMSDIRPILGLGTRMSDPYVFVALWGPKIAKQAGESL